MGCWTEPVCPPARSNIKDFKVLPCRLLRLIPCVLHACGRLLAPGAVKCLASKLFTAPWGYSRPGQGWWSVLRSLAAGWCCSGALVHVATWAKRRRPAGCIMPVSSASPRHAGRRTWNLSPNKPSCPRTTPASMNLLTGPSTLDSPLLMLLSVLPPQPLLLMLSQWDVCLIEQQALLRAFKSLVSHPETSAGVWDSAAVSVCSFRQAANEHNSVQPEAGWWMGGFYLGNKHQFLHLIILSHWDLRILPQQDASRPDCWHLRIPLCRVHAHAQYSLILVIRRNKHKTPS